MGRSRRWFVVGVALAAIVGGSAVAWGVLTTESDDPGPAPSTATVLSADDAEPSTSRASRRIWRDLTGDVRLAGVPWTSDLEPRLIVGAHSYPTSVELVDRRTGERTPLPTLWKGHDVSVLPVRLTDRAVWVSWVHHVDGVRRPAVLRYDVATGRHRLLLAPEVPHHARANFTTRLQYGADGRYYFRTFRTGHDGPSKFTQVWSFAPDAPREVREEGPAHQWTVTGPLLAFLDQGDGGPTTVHLRDLTTGAGDTRTLDSCDDPYLEASSTFAVVACEEDSALIVLDRSGAELARLRVPDGVNPSGHGPPSLHVGERWISIGRLAYEPATGRLLRLHEHPAGS